MQKIFAEQGGVREELLNTVFLNVIHGRPWISLDFRMKQIVLSFEKYGRDINYDDILWIHAEKMTWCGEPYVTCLENKMNKWGTSVLNVQWEQGIVVLVLKSTVP